MVRRENFKPPKNLTTEQLQQAGADAGGADAGRWGFRMDVEQM